MNRQKLLIFFSTVCLALPQASFINTLDKSSDAYQIIAGSNFDPKVIHFVQANKNLYKETQFRKTIFCNELIENTTEKPLLGKSLQKNAEEIKILRQRNKLTRIDARILSLKREGLPFKEIAKIEKIKVTAARKRYSRAINKLKKLAQMTNTQN